MPITRRQFFSRLKKLGFSKARLQMTRIGLTYTKMDGDSEVILTVPKHHSTSFHILGDVPYSGIFHEKSKDEDRPISWGVVVDTEELGMDMFEVCLGLCSGELRMGPADEEAV